MTTFSYQIEMLITRPKIMTNPLECKAPNYSEP